MEDWYLHALRNLRRPRLMSALLFVAALLVLTAGIVIRVADLHFQTVLSNSMRPVAAAGDVAVTQGVPIDKVQVGDVITFFPPDSRQPVMHRIASLRDGVITTRGDANTVDDSWHVKLTGATGYRLVAVVPSLGWLTQFQRPALLGAGLLVGLLILLELTKEVRARTKRHRAQAQT